MVLSAAILGLVLIGGVLLWPRSVPESPASSMALADDQIRDAVNRGEAFLAFDPSPYCLCRVLLSHYDAAVVTQALMRLTERRQGTENLAFRRTLAAEAARAFGDHRDLPVMAADLEGLQPLYRLFADDPDLVVRETAAEQLLLVAASGD